MYQYLSGGGNLSTNNDAKWSNYMKANEQLANTLYIKTYKIAQDLFEKGNGEVKINERFHTEIENGEGIIGYHYLHGTNDFQIVGKAEVSGSDICSADGSSETVINFTLSFVWNDRMDPNSNYKSDSIKSTIAEIITFGFADAYDIQIRWDTEVELKMDDLGDVKEFNGWPGEE